MLDSGALFAGRSSTRFMLEDDSSAVVGQGCQDVVFLLEALCNLEPLRDAGRRTRSELETETPNCGGKCISYLWPVAALIRLNSVSREDGTLATAWAFDQSPPARGSRRRTASIATSEASARQ